MTSPARERALAYLARRGIAPGLAPIQGDASTRVYFRVTAVTPSEVLLVEPEAGAERSQPFLSIGRFLAAVDLGPPRILDHAPDLGVVALEDLGEVSLRRALESAGHDPTARRDLFAQALALLVRLQGEGTAALTPDVHAWHVRFDRAVFERELAMFRARCLGDLLRLRLGPDDERALEGGLSWLARTLADQPQVLTHRDYHIDNLMVTGGRLRMIDFQDARWGPASYDPASLLTDRDVHRFLDPGAAAALLGTFVTARGIDRGSFAREYALALTQRSLKACGTFSDQVLARGRESCRAYVAPSLARARAAAAPFPELAGVHRALVRAGELPGQDSACGVVLNPIRAPEE